MGHGKRTELTAEAHRRNLEQLSRLGSELKSSRRRRRQRQVDVAARAGLTQGTVSRIERGYGGSLSLDTWQVVGLAVGRLVRFDVAPDALREPADAGHLAIQELVLRLARRVGFERSFELPGRATPSTGWTDVGLRADRRRLLVLVECWNTIGDIGSSARASDRKRSEAEAHAIATAPLDGTGTAVAYRVRTCWVVRATIRNRGLVARYPEIFASRFPGSSLAWTRALTSGGEPPEQAGLIWCDVATTRLFPWRRFGSSAWNPDEHRP